MIQLSFIQNQTMLNINLIVEIKQAAKELKFTIIAL